jgi:hypothetical protein
MGLKINGSTSGSIEIDVPAVAGTNTAITIPVENGGTFVVSESSGKSKFSGAIYGIENTITAIAFDLNSGNFWTCGAIAVPNPTNVVAGLMGSIRVTAAPTSFGSNFDFPGGSYTAPATFPAVAPFYCVDATTILLGSWTEGIA